MVVELQVGGEWIAFAADRFPTELDDAIKAKHTAFYMATNYMTPEELFNVIPIGLRITHQIDSDIMPGIAKYPVDEWAATESPSYSIRAGSSCV